MSKVEMHAIVYGRVQGVFFRSTTRHKALKMGITGTVKNLPNGTVEIFAVGEKRKLDELIKELTGDKGPGLVSKTELGFTESAVSYEGFRIIP